MDKSNWQVKKLDEICNVEYGTRVVRKRDGGSIFPVYGGGGKTFFLDTYNRENCLVISRFAMSPKCTRFIKGKFFLNDSGLTVSTKNNNLVVQKFLDLQLIFLNDYIYTLSRGTAQKNLDVSTFRNIEIFYPASTAEQYRIVKKLDKVFEQIEKAKVNTEKNLLNLKELFESYLENIITKQGKSWENRKLYEISDNLDSKRIPVTKKVRNYGKYPYYGASGIVDYTNEYLFNDDLLLVSEDGANLLARRYPIAFSISGKTWVNNHAHVLKFKKIECQKFVEYYLNSIELDSFVSGMAQPKLNQKMLNTIIIPFPPFPEQKSIVKKLDELSEKTKRLENIYQQKLANLKELKKSLLRKAFNGEL